MSFEFVPRRVVKHSKTHIAASRPANALNTPSVASGSSATRNAQAASAHSQHQIPGGIGSDAAEEWKRHSRDARPSYSSAELAALVLLSLSDYALFSSPELRRTIDSHPEHYIPLSCVFSNSPSVRAAGLSSAKGIDAPLEAEVVRALRSECAGKIDVRLALEREGIGWHGSKKSMHEIRRLDYAQRTAETYAKEIWDRRTVYFENIPPPRRSLPAMAVFLGNLASTCSHDDSLPSASSTSSSKPDVIQSITFPPHHLDTDTDIPKSKGFALVTFASEEHAERACTIHPWDRRFSHLQSKPEADASHDSHAAALREARKYDLRALSKTRWDELNEEYRAYQRRLAEQIAPPNDSHKPEMHSITSQPNVYRREEPPGEEPSHLTGSHTYPQNVLLFARNLESGTNKTALRALFSGETPDSGLDYVDFTKGMDSCHLRVSTPAHGARLLALFPPDSPSGPILEPVQGRREALYWEQVPERVRLDALQKAVAAQTDTNGSAGAMSHDTDLKKKGKKRKRTSKGVDPDVS